MRVRWLGWAGAEYEHDGETVVVDPLADPAATFAGFGAAADDVELPQVVAPPAGAVAGLVSHLHRDHADAAALGRRSRPAPWSTIPSRGAIETWPSLRPSTSSARRGSAPRGRGLGVGELGPFTCTALPAVDGLGDPQVSWLVEAGGVRSAPRRHGLSRRLVADGAAGRAVRRRAGPVNGPSSTSPTSSRRARSRPRWSPSRRRWPASCSAPRTVIPMHYGGFAFEPHYVPVPDARQRFEAAAAGRSYRAAPLAPGETAAGGDRGRRYSAVTWSSARA